MYDKGLKLKRTEINLKTLLYFISRFKSLYYIYDYHIKNTKQNNQIEAN